jgi:hypothetical protein
MSAAQAGRIWCAVTCIEYQKWLPCPKRIRRIARAQRPSPTHPDRFAGVVPRHHANFDIARRLHLRHTRGTVENLDGCHTGLAHLFAVADQKRSHGHSILGEKIALDLQAHDESPVGNRGGKLEEPHGRSRRCLLLLRPQAEGRCPRPAAPAPRNSQIAFIIGGGGRGTVVEPSLCEISKV